MSFLKKNKYSILKSILKYSFVLVILFSMATTSVLALDGTASNTADTTGIQTNIKNPLGEGNLEDIPSFIEKIIEIVLVVGVPIIALAIIYSGFLFVQARGNPEGLKKAKSTLLYTIIGAALLLGAWVIAKAIGGTVEDIKSNA